jgi:adenylate kinase family enzyme
LIRIKTYNESTVPIIQYFDAKKMVWRIDGSKTEEAVYAEVEATLKEINC